MNRKLIATLIAASISTAGFAGINSPGADGYLSRGISMYADRNYEGCLDQLTRLATLSPTRAQSEEALYYAAMATQGVGDDEAVTLLKHFLKKYPASSRRPSVMMAIGDYYFTRSAYADALKAYAELDPQALDGASAEDYIYRVAYCNMLLGEFNAASAGFDRLTSTTLYGSAARFYKAYIDYAERRYDEALKLFSTVDTSTVPGDAAAYYMAQINFHNDNYEMALELARRCLADGKYPEFTPECNRIAGESLYNLGRDSEALDYLWKYAAETTSPQPSAFYILGLSEYRQGNMDNAIKLLQRAVGSNNAMEQSALLTLGQAYQRRGDNDAALMAFERAYKMEFDPKVQETAFYNYAVARLDGGRVPFGSSITLFEDFLSRYPRSPYANNILEYMVSGYMTDNDYSNALKSIERISSPSESVLTAKQRVLFQLATREYSAGKISDALDHLKEAATLSRYNKSIADQVRFWEGDCYYALGNYEKAAEAYLAYLAAAPASDAANRRLAYYDLGYTRFAQERYGDALTDFRRVIDSPAGLSAVMLADAYNRAADCLYYSSDFTQASKYYQKAYDTNPSAGDYALFQLAVMKGNLRDYTGKIAIIDRLIADFPSSGLVPRALLEKAESYVATGNNTKAIEAYNVLVTNYPNTSQGRNGYLQLAITSLNNGDRKGAIEAYKRVITSYPTSEEARLASDDLKRLYADDGKLTEFAAFLNSVPDAPTIDAGEIETLSFEAAENAYVNDGTTHRLELYLEEYPSSAHSSRALYYLIDDAWNSGNTVKALKLAEELTTRFPDSETAEEAMLIKAEAESSVGKKETALATYRALQERASTSDILHEARLGEMHVAAELSRYSEVVAVTDKMLASTAASPEELTEIRFNRAWALNGLHRYDESDKEWEALAANTEDLFGSQAAYSLAQSLFDRGKTSQAKKTVNELIDANSPHSYWLARGFILYSDILRSEGNTFEADEYLRSLRSNYPGSEKDIFKMIDTRLNAASK